MDTLQRLMDLIVTRAREEADVLLRAARERQAVELAEAEENSQRIFIEKKEQLARWSEERMQAELLRRLSALRKERTRYRQQLMDAVFQEAENELCRMPAQQFITFYHQAIAGLPLRGEYIVRVGEWTALKLEKAEWEALSLKNDTFSLSIHPHTIPREGGFMLERHPMEYSFLYRELLDEIKKREGAHIMKLLLG